MKKKISTLSIVSLIIILLVICSVGILSVHYSNPINIGYHIPSRCNVAPPKLLCESFYVLDNGIVQAILKNRLNQTIESLTVIGYTTSEGHIKGNCTISNSNIPPKFTTKLLCKFDPDEIVEVGYAIRFDINLTYAIEKNVSKSLLKLDIFTRVQKRPKNIFSKLILFLLNILQKSI